MILEYFSTWKIGVEQSKVPVGKAVPGLLPCARHADASVEDRTVGYTHIHNMQRWRKISTQYVDIKGEVNKQ